MSAASAAPAGTRVFRLPALAYLAVLFLFLGTIPLAFASDASEGSRADLSARGLLFLIPIAVGFFIARTATIISPDAIVVRALFGSRRLRWSEVRGLSVQGRSIYAVGEAGSVRLPCIRVSDLAAVAQASGGHLPELPTATPKPAPGGRRR